jgi:hypothetical protein
MKKKSDKAREALRKRMLAPPEAPLETTRKFVRACCSGNSPGAAETMIAAMAKENATTLRRGLAGMEALLSAPPSAPGLLRDLILLDAGWSLDGDNSDAEATLVLRKLVATVRKQLSLASKHR